MYDYNRLIKVFKEKNCALLSTEEEIRKQPQRVPKVKYIASCGHENTVFVNVFIGRNTGVVCKDCIARRYKDTQPTCNYIEQEFHGFVKLKSYIEKDFDIIKICDGACIDYAIKPKHNNTDKYIALQIKSTNSKKHDMFSFAIYNKYKDIIIVCIQLELDYYWVIDGNIDLPRKLNITYKKKSKYDEYKVPKDELSNKFKSLYHTYKLYNLDEINVPKSAFMKIEHQYRMLRERSLPFLQFTHPDYEGLVYDFKIDHKKFQEKVAQHNKKSYSSLIAKRADKAAQNYIKGDNDFYWINIPDTMYFYIIPEFEFLKHDIVAYTSRLGRKALTLNPTRKDHKHAWANQYLFNYSKPDIPKIQALIAADYSAIEEGEMYVKMLELWDV